MRTVTGRLAALAFLACVLAAVPARAGAAGSPTGAADMAGGYGWQVLDKVLPLWQPPAGSSGRVIAAVRVGSNGEILYCEPRSPSGNPAMDMAACSAVARAGRFDAPPGGVPVEVFLALPGAPIAPGASPSAVPQGMAAPDQPVEPAPYPAAADPARPVGNYADLAMERIRPHLRVPPGFKGEATVVLHMRVDDRGRVVAAEVVEATGSTRSVEDAVLQAVSRAGTMPPPGESRRLVLTFTLRGL